MVNTVTGVSDIAGGLGGPMSSYDFDFREDGPYGAALRLLDGTDLSGKAVLDIGCGSAAVAPPLARRGAEYVGVDSDEDAILKLIEAGFEGHAIDLVAPDVGRALADVVGGRKVAAVLCLDVLEHLPNPERLLSLLVTATDGDSDVELIVSVPNVAHLDLARQLLCGHWNTTDSGLLDRTHLRFFTERTLVELMSSAGWYQGACEDFRLEQSDQYVGSHPVFSNNANLGALLKRVRDGSDSLGNVNQFVRRFHRGADRTTDTIGTSAPFLSVIIRTMGTRNSTLLEVLCCLAAQTDLDFEVLLVVHDSGKLNDVRRLVELFEGNLSQRVRLSSCDGGTRGKPANIGLRSARGEYIAFLDDDDLVTAEWAEGIKQGATERPGMVIRSWSADQERSWGESGELADHQATGPLRSTYSNNFDLVRHIRQNETPFHCFAFPRTLVDLGFAFNEALTVCEDWHFLLRAAATCGVHDIEKMTAIYNRWSGKASSHAVSPEEWMAMRSYIQVELDEAPLLLPPGSIRKLDQAAERAEVAERRTAHVEAELAAARSALAEHAQVSLNAHQALDEIRDSTSWKVSAPVRTASLMGRRVLGRLRKGIS
jgi:SAM-dependent methyltransferase